MIIMIIMIIQIIVTMILIMLMILMIIIIMLTPLIILVCNNGNHAINDELNNRPPVGEMSKLAGSWEICYV